MTNNIPHQTDTISLLFPDASRRNCYDLNTRTFNDLELAILFQHVTPPHLTKQYGCDPVKDTVLKQCLDPDTIAYRQEIFSVLLDYPELLSAFERLLPIINALNFYTAIRYSGQTSLFILVSRIGELETFLKCVDTLMEGFNTILEATGQNMLPARGLQKLHEYMLTTYTDENFAHLRKHLPEIAARARAIRSVSIGINLSDAMRPVEATITSIDSRSYSGKSQTLFDKLFPESKDGFSGLTPIRSVYTDPSSYQETKAYKTGIENPLFNALFNDLSELLEKLCGPIIKSVSRYMKIKTSLFSNILRDIIFYIQGTKFLLSVKEKGMPLCRPEIAPMDERITEIEEGYNVNLFIQMLARKDGKEIRDVLVTNRIALNDEGRIALLTGPNQGGKTVYTQATGIAQVLFQAGFFLPGTEARISPADAVLTHFQIDEHICDETGRFADEAKRLHENLKQATSRTLLLMNESFASTNYDESLEIAGNVLKILRLMGLRVIFSTHFHTLAGQTGEINKTSGGKSKLISLVSMIVKPEKHGEPMLRTFKIMPGPPMGKSYAGEIAEKYGIGYSQLLGLVKNKT
ncbi:MAG: hypothetical protein JW969_11035 [Spirochaetales bacterium]|nr:hypothetical protein [Spirochaetales bacterium]